MLKTRPYLASAALLLSLGAGSAAMATNTPKAPAEETKAPAPPARLSASAAAAAASEDRAASAVKMIPFVEPPAVRSMNPDCRSMPGSLSAGSANLGHYLKERLGADAKLVGTDFNLGPIAPLGAMTMVGTDTPGGAPEFLILTRTDPAWGGDAILSHLRLADGEDVRDIQWVHPELVLAAMGEGTLRFITVSSSREMKVHGTLPPLHTATVREIAINHGNRAQFASGGYDRILNLVDLERPDALQSIKQEGVIGSIRWPLCNQNVCPSLTLDDGTFLIYDTRTRPIGPPAFKATMGKKELFSHDRYTDHNVVLGFGDGEIQHIDVRVTDRVLHKVQDPFVEAIGAMRWSPDGGTLMVSGIPGVTIWRVKADGSLGILGHQRPGTGKPGGELTAYNADFSDASSIVWTAGAAMGTTHY